MIVVGIEPVCMHTALILKCSTDHSFCVNREEMRSAWQPFIDWLDQRPDNFTHDPFVFISFPGRAFWNPNFNFFASDPSPYDPLEPERGFFWSANRNEISRYWMVYTSRYLTYEHILEDTEVLINININKGNI